MTEDKKIDKISVIEYKFKISLLIPYLQKKGHITLSTPRAQGSSQVLLDVPCIPPPPLKKG